MDSTPVRALDDVPAGITVAQLRAFFAVASHHHVTRAAVELGLTQPAVSHQLRALEAALGLPLVERFGRGIRLTAEGEAMLPAVTTALSAVRTMGEMAGARRGLRGAVLRIAASNTVGIYRLPDWLASFLEGCPELEIRARMVNTGGAIELLRKAEVDCALVEGPCSTENLEVMTLDRDELVVVAASTHPLATRTMIEREDLRGHRYLAREDGSGTEALAAQLLGNAYRQGPVLELDQVDAVRTGVLIGLGYAVLPTLAIAEDLRAQRVAVLPLARPALHRSLRAARRPHTSGPALEAFWSHLVGISRTQTAPRRPRDGRPLGSSGRGR